ncbi:DNA repair protein RecO, partial [bacterium]|nr:DNA repair protein RecO [bacterium]
MNTSVSDVGIVLRRKSFSEADLLLTILSKENGKIVVLAKGSRKIKSKFMGHFEPFCLVKFSCIKGRSFFIMTSLETLDSHFSSKENPESIKIYSYISEVVDALTPELEKNEILFLKMKDYLNTKDISRVSVVSFLFSILETSGFAPQILKCSKCGKDETVLEHFSFYWGGLVCPECSVGSSSKKIKKDTIKFLK